MSRPEVLESRSGANSNVNVGELAALQEAKAAVLVAKEETKREVARQLGNNVPVLIAVGGTAALIDHPDVWILGLVVAAAYLPAIIQEVLAGIERIVKALAEKK